MSITPPDAHANRTQYTRSSILPYFRRTKMGKEKQSTSIILKKAGGDIHPPAYLLLFRFNPCPLGSIFDLEARPLDFIAQGIRVCPAFFITG
jgi:hypothetical protein